MRYPRPLCNPFIVCEHAWSAVEKCKAGIVLECGVYDGCTSAALNYALRQSPYFSNIQQYAFDTFEGMPYDGTEQEQTAKFFKGHLSTSNKKSTIESLDRLGIKVYPGIVEDTLPRAKKNFETVISERNLNFEFKIAFAFLDLDLETPTKFCVEFLIDKILPGGRIGFHDYDENPKYALHGICQVVKKYLSKNKSWKEVIRTRRRDNRFIFFEKI